MKKISLKDLKLDENDLVSDNQLHKIFGGGGYSTGCKNQCSTSSDCNTAQDEGCYYVNFPECPEPITRCVRNFN